MEMTDMQLEQGNRVFVERFFRIVIWVLVAVGAVMLLDAVHIFWLEQFLTVKVSNQVMVALIIGAAVNLLGLAAVIVKYLSKK